MKRVRSVGVFFGVFAVWCFAGCDRFIASETVALEIFPVEVMVTGPSGSQLAGIPVTFAFSDQLTTNEQGRLRVNYQGSVGGRLHIKVHIPDRFEAVEDVEREFVLTHGADGRPAAVRFAVPVEAVEGTQPAWRPPPGSNRYVVVVDSDCDGQQVDVDGEYLGTTDEDGYLEQHFWQLPGRRLEVVARQRKRCAELRCTFRLSSRSAILNVRPDCGKDDREASAEADQDRAPERTAQADQDRKAEQEVEAEQDRAPARAAEAEQDRNAGQPAEAEQDRAPARASPADRNREASSAMASAGEVAPADDLENNPPKTRRKKRRRRRRRKKVVRSSDERVQETAAVDDTTPIRVPDDPPPALDFVEDDVDFGDEDDFDDVQAPVVASAGRTASAVRTDLVERMPTEVAPAAKVFGTPLRDDVERPGPAPQPEPPPPPSIEPRTRLRRESPAKKRPEPPRPLIRPADGRATFVTCRPTGLDLYVDSELVLRSCGDSQIYLSPGVHKLTMSGPDCAQTEPIFVEIPRSGTVPSVSVAGDCRSSCLGRVRAKLDAGRRLDEGQLACLKKSSSRESRFLEAKLMLAHVYMRQGQPKRAEQVLMRALKTRRGRSDPELRARLAELLGRRKQLDKASRQAEAAWRYRMKFRGTRAQREQWILNTLKLRAGFFEQLFYAEEEFKYYQKAIATYADLEKTARQSANSSMVSYARAARDRVKVQRQRLEGE
ncbi:MAG: tetratricopeptide repeat protein [Myxococcota bacterium]